ncbi:hypothetical protein [Paracoccus aminovorans]|uniref:hypothetical protein n=1 Tax=Paracoccus aminovorans TaxID=34004 RepID=UPI0012E3BAAD|nr:hypothetical protein [Paracoccus aminovorans]
MLRRFTGSAAIRLNPAAQPEGHTYLLGPLRGGRHDPNIGCVAPNYIIAEQTILQASVYSSINLQNLSLHPAFPRPRHWWKKIKKGSVCFIPCMGA